MRIIQWTSEFAVGIDGIDEQHRALIDMINALEAGTHCDSSPQTTKRLLGRLNDYVRVHFSLEERLMAGAGCSLELVTRHFGEHAYFRSILKDLTADFESGRSGITTALIDYLVHWFLHHIMVVDREMSHQLKTTEPELEARVRAALVNDVTEHLTDAERQLFAELRHTNRQLEQRAVEDARMAGEKERRLEAELREARVQVQWLSAQLAAR